MGQFRPIDARTYLPDPATAATLMGRYVLSMEAEALLVACLDKDGRVLGLARVTSGSDRRVEGRIRDVIVYALSCQAESLILAHNHPSGDIRPSRTDLETTRRLGQVCRVLSIRLQDHLILSGKAWSSMRCLGLL